MFLENDIRYVEGYGKADEHVQLKPQEIKFAEQLVETLSEDFEPSKYRNNFPGELKTACGNRKPPIRLHLSGTVETTKAAAWRTKGLLPFPATIRGVITGCTSFAPIMVTD
jgi:hypothetical protein